MELRNGEQLLERMRGFQIPCVLAAAADLDLFNLLAAAPMSAPMTANRLAGDLKAVTILLDALAGIGVLVKTEDRYSLAPALALFLVDDSPESVAAMLRHQANCLRHWARLPWIIHSGESIDGSSIRGAEADQQSFIEAMHVVSRAVAEPLIAEIIAEINPGGFRCVLDIGGASGTWTVAWCKAEPAARAILFDLPAVIPLAQQRLAEVGISDRVVLIPGDYHTDPLPRGADLVWLSAIIHQNSPDQNRSLYHRIAACSLHKAQVAKQESKQRRKVRKPLEHPVVEDRLRQSCDNSWHGDDEQALDQCQPAQDRYQDGPIGDPDVVV